MNYRQTQKDNTRKLILRTAYAMFGEKGYRNTTMRALADQAGIGLGTIFKHFPDKPSILAATYQEDLEATLQNAFKSLPANGLKLQMLHLTKSIYEFYETSPSFSRALIKEVLFLKGEHGESLQNHLHCYLENIARLIKRSIEQGEISPDNDPQTGALAYLSFYFTSLLMGLNEATFDVSKQLSLFENLIDAHFFRKGRMIWT